MPDLTPTETADELVILRTRVAMDQVELDEWRAFALEIDGLLAEYGVPVADQPLIDAVRALVAQVHEADRRTLTLALRRLAAEDGQLYESLRRFVADALAPGRVDDSERRQLQHQARFLAERGQA